jgi:hypothetical protein
MTLAGADGHDLDEQRARAQARAARFAADAAKPPPPLPTHRRTVSTGKVAKPKSEKDVLSAFIKRKLAAQATLDDSVMDKARTLGLDLHRLAEEAAADLETPSEFGLAEPRQNTVSSLDDDLDSYWRSSPTKSTANRVSSFASFPAPADATGAATLHRETAPISGSQTAAAKVGGGSSSIRKARHRRWRLSYLLLARKLTLRTPQGFSSWVGREVGFVKLRKRDGGSIARGR